MRRSPFLGVLRGGMRRKSYARLGHSRYFGAGLTVSWIAPYVAQTVTDNSPVADPKTSFGVSLPRLKKVQGCMYLEVHGWRYYKWHVQITVQMNMWRLHPYKGTLLACCFRRFGEIMRLVSGDGFSIPLSEIGLKKFPFSIISI